MRMEAEAFEQAVMEHQRMVFSVALHALCNRALAEEISQDVFLALLEHGGALASREHVVHWLRRVASRKCIDQIRRQRLRQWVGLRESDEVQISCSGARPQADPLLAARLRRLIRSLPATARVALVLRYEEELEAAEIGRVMGLSEQAVRQKLRQALSVLQERLDPERRVKVATEWEQPK